MLRPCDSSDVMVAAGRLWFMQTSRCFRSHDAVLCCPALALACIIRCKCTSNPGVLNAASAADCEDASGSASGPASAAGPASSRCRKARKLVHVAGCSM